MLLFTHAVGLAEQGVGIFFQIQFDVSGILETSKSVWSNRNATERTPEGFWITRRSFVLRSNFSSKSRVPSRDAAVKVEKHVLNYRGFKVILDRSYRRLTGRLRFGSKVKLTGSILPVKVKL